MCSEKITIQSYILAEACKNRFVLFDCLSGPSVDACFFKHAHELLIKEDRDDALILTESKIQGQTLYARMLVLGCDGAFGEFCGNGARCCAAFLFSHYPQFKEFYLFTNSGKYRLSVDEQGFYSVQLSPASISIVTKFIADRSLFENENGFHFFFFKKKRFFYVETLEPHLLIAEKLSDEELFQIGREINELQTLFPFGMNVNAFYSLSPGNIYVKTYERGVQRLTHSCGTGSLACAVFYLSGKSGNIKVETPGGTLDISLREEFLILKGPADFGIKKFI